MTTEAVASTFDARGWTVFIISVRDPRTDFRQDLATALRKLGATVLYIRLGRRCLIDDGTSSGEDWRSPFVVLYRLTRLNNAKSCLFLTVNTGFLLFSALMRLFSLKVIWLFDEHDDLLYGARGIRRFLEQVKLGVFRQMASRSICVSPNLCKRVPGSALVPNASSVRRHLRQHMDFSKIVILSNIDERFDFGFVWDFMAAAPPIEVHIFGAESTNRAIASNIEGLRTAETVIFHGAYRGEDIQSILDRFSVMLVPYLLNESTYYIDPLRFYHALNNGLEIVASRIPRAGDLRDRLHLVDDGTEAARVITALCNGGRPPKNQRGFSPITWEGRARDVLYVAESLRPAGSMPTMASAGQDHAPRNVPNPQAKR